MRFNLRPALTTLFAFLAVLLALTAFVSLQLTGALGPGFVLGALFVTALGLRALYDLLQVTLFQPLHAVGAALAAGEEALPAGLPPEFAPLVAGYGELTAEHARRRAALEAELRRSALLSRLAVELRESLDPATIAELVLRDLGAGLSFDHGILILTGPQGAAETAYTWRDGAALPLEHSAAQKLLAGGLEGRARGYDGATLIAGVGPGGAQTSGSAIALPIRRAATDLGVLTLYVQRPDAFDDADLLLLESVGALVGVALSAAIRYQEERQRGRQAMALLAISQMLTVERTPAELAAALDELGHTVFQADYTLLYLNDAEGAPILVRTQPAQQLSDIARAGADDAAAAARAGSLNAAVHDQPGSAAAQAGGQNAAVGAQSGPAAPTRLALPLVHAGRALGACVLVREAGAAEPFPPGLWSLLTVFTNIVASACANIELVERLRSYTDELEGEVERHTAELRRSRDLLRIVFDNQPEGLLLFDCEGRLLAANNAFCRGIVGRLPREVVGRDYRRLWADLASQTELELAPQGPSESGAPLVPPAGAEFHRKPAAWRVLGTDLVGQRRWYAVDRFPVMSLDGRHEQYLERWSDITHHEELQRRLLLHEQLTSLGRLAASVAHEVGNPLQSAMGCLELCREQADLGPTPREYLDLALGELDRMSRTMDSLRNLYRPPQLSWERVDLNQILRQVALFTERQLVKARVRLELDLDDALPPIVGQADALRQVFLNLTLNAQEALPNGGLIRVSSERKDTDRMCLITVRDTGVGMSHEQLERLFEPFRSGKAQGVGLGLYLSKQIIDQHTGHIEVASRQGQGTTITVLLPWSDAGPARGREHVHADEVDPEE